MRSRGLRYFNVFGPRQDPNGAYAAVIPKWIAQLSEGTAVQINGDGETSRDFCFVDNAVQANLRAALTSGGQDHEVFNVAVGERTSLNQLYAYLKEGIARRRPEVVLAEPVYADFRAGDVRHSQASIERAGRVLGYEPSHAMREGLELTLDWFLRETIR